MRNPKKELVGIGTAAVVESDGQPMRLVACLAKADATAQARCQRQLDELAASLFTALPPAGVRVNARPRPSIAGRQFDAPSECRVTANDRVGTVDCGGVVLGWNEPADPHTVMATRDAAISDMTQQMQGKYPAAPTPKRSSRGCKIEGVASTCVVARWPDFTVTVGTAVVRGHSIVAWCLAHDGTEPTICKDALDTGR
jgi:hypothetical protein